ncbi:hypothetical protein [Micromonospora halophytica]|uniref:hypothetical protein n=1 Tax=Micromonospora halophytica TaxID=47864 RepID=UPI001112FE5E|nr:hypothetical protein [Micromonospora halophytica]
MLVIGFVVLPLDRAVSPLWQADRQVDLGVVSEMDLRYEYFWSRIEFTVDGVDLGSRWGGMPLLDFAASIKRVPDSISRNGRAEIDLTESSTIISFVRHSGLVRVSDTVSQDVCCCSMSDLLDAVSAFIDKVATTLVGAHPDIKNNEFFKELVSSLR